MIAFKCLAINVLMLAVSVLTDNFCLQSGVCPQAVVLCNSMTLAEAARIAHVRAQKKPDRYEDSCPFRYGDVAFFSVTICSFVF